MSEITRKEAAGRPEGSQESAELQQSITDLRDTPFERRDEVVVARCDVLRPGESELLVSDRPEQEVLVRLQRDRPGRFEWYELESEPGRWTAKLVKRPREASPQRGVVEFMQADHQRIHRLVEGLADSLRDRRVAQARALCRSLATGLRHHMAVEEELLLPVIAERLISPKGPAALLREQHEHVEQILQKLERELGTLGLAPDVPRLVPIVDRLHELLVSHGELEEEILYTVTDLLLSPAERDELVRRCQAASAVELRQ